MEIINKIKKLIELHKLGILGGETMPEDNNPGLDKNSNENYIYFTLPMALNYQRNSYKLWEAALKSFNDNFCKDIFNPFKVFKMSDKELQEKLTKHKLALQPNKQTQIWKKLCHTLVEKFNGNVINLFEAHDNDIDKIKTFILQNKKDFPYLSGTKILNYWLYVMTQYTNTIFKNRQQISVAPDTHVLQASLKLGVIKDNELSKNNIREIVSFRWQEILKDTNIQPIDIHTPMWLWSRNNFKIVLQ